MMRRARCASASTSPDTSAGDQVCVPAAGTLRERDLEFGLEALLRKTEALQLTSMEQVLSAASRLRMLIE